MLKIMGAALAALALCQPLYGAELDAPAKRHVHRGHWSPEHHIIEVAITPLVGRAFVINGARFSAKNGPCRGWEAGQRVALLSGEWHGYCGTAVFRNLTRGGTCEMWCGYYGWLY